MKTDSQIVDNIIESIRAMSVEEYSELYDSISDEENVTVYTDTFEITITSGSISFLNKPARYDQVFPPIEVDKRTVAVPANSNYALAA